MRFYKFMALLLEYPSNEFCAHLKELAETVDEFNLSADEKQVLAGFIAWCQSLDATALQAKYVETFDLTPDHCLYLTHHLYEEEDRERGATLATLKEFFRHNGFEVANGELPDYVPLILEFVSQCDDLAVTGSLLQQSGPALEEVATRLVAHQLPWGPLLEVLINHLDPARHQSEPSITVDRPQPTASVA